MNVDGKLNVGFINAHIIFLELELYDQGTVFYNHLLLSKSAENERNTTWHSEEVYRYSQIWSNKSISYILLLHFLYFSKLQIVCLQ